MRAPPPVEYPSALGRAWRTALSLLVGASVAVPLAWGLPYFAAHWGSRQPDPWLEALGNPLLQGLLALWIAAMAVAAFWLARRRDAAGERILRWDGQDWILAAGADARSDQRGDARLMLDLGPWMLVRFAPYAAGALGLGASTWLPLSAAGALGLGASTWLPLSAAGDLARWAALRGALWNWRSQRVGRP